MLNTLNFYRAISDEDYFFYRNYGFVWRFKEWVEYNLEKERNGFCFSSIKDMVDGKGDWGSKNKDYDAIIKVAGFPKIEFVISETLPLWYENEVDIRFSRVVLVYDPRAIISSKPLFLEERLVPELNLFKPSENK